MGADRYDDSVRFYLIQDFLETVLYPYGYPDTFPCLTDQKVLKFPKILALSSSWSVKLMVPPSSPVFSSVTLVPALTR